MDGSALIAIERDVERSRGVSAALAVALARVTRDRRDEAWQDGLDLIAVIAGLKPACLLGRGARDEAWIDGLHAIAVREGLRSVAAAAWEPDARAAALPGWYLDATARRRAALPVLYLCRDAATLAKVAALSAAGRVTVADEAAFLGYPACCVAQHHAQTLELERLLAKMAERAAWGDLTGAARMIEAGVEPLPRSREEWASFESLTAIAPSRFTSVNMCDACAADGDAPAQILSRRYETLAARAQYPAR